MALLDEDKEEISSIIKETLKGEKELWKQEQGTLVEKVEEIIPAPQPTKTNQQLEEELKPPIAEEVKQNKLLSMIKKMW